MNYCIFHRTSETIIDPTVEIDPSTLENEESNQQSPRQTSLDDNSFYEGFDELQSLPIKR
jgi:hypothetical protein